MRARIGSMALSQQVDVVGCKRQRTFSTSKTWRPLGRTRAMVGANVRVSAKQWMRAARRGMGSDGHKVALHSAQQASGRSQPAVLGVLALRGATAFQRAC